jgi:hypothetical protein
MKVFWQPQPKQEQALLRTEDEILFGGSRGGGKTDTGIVWLIEPKYIAHPRYRGLVIRRNADDLKDWIDRAAYLFQPLRAKPVGNPTEFLFPSGAKIRTGHLKDQKAYTKYQGHEYQKQLIEELTHIPRESDYEKLIGSCRSTIPELKPQNFGTTNPDGDGFEWVKVRWNIPDWPIGIVVTRNKRTGRTRVFIPSKVEDNRYLYENTGYVAYLDSIKDETLRKQWRHGYWGTPIIEGAYYTRQLEQARAEGRITRVPVEPHIPVHTFWDLGVGDSMAIWLVQFVGKEARLVKFISGEGEGISYYLKEIRDWTNLRNYTLGSHFMPHDAEVREMFDGVTRKEKAEQAGFRPIYVVPKYDPEEGIDEARMFFARCWFDKDNCTEGLRCLKHYRKEYDEKRQSFKNQPFHNWASHGADAFRYLAVAYRVFLNVAGTGGLGPRRSKMV